MADSNEAPQADKDKDFERFYSLATGYEGGGVFSVEGVIFDLICGLDKEIWVPLHPLGLHDSRSIMYGPELVFPWTSDAVKALMAKDALPVTLQAGDRIYVSLLKDSNYTTVFGAFENTSDASIKLACLSVERGDGSRIDILKPYIFIKRGSIEALIRVEDFSQAHQGLTERFSDVFRVTDIDEVLDGPVNLWPKPAPHISKSYLMAFMSLAEARKNFDEDAYVSFGYMMARAESEDMLLEFAIRGRAAKKFQEKAAEGRKNNSRIATEPLRDLAKKVIQELGDVSLGGCAREVSKLLDLESTWKLNKDPKWIEST